MLARGRAQRYPWYVGQINDRPRRGRRIEKRNLQEAFS